MFSEDIDYEPLLKSDDASQPYSFNSQTTSPTYLDILNDDHLEIARRNFPLELPQKKLDLLKTSCSQSQKILSKQALIKVKHIIKHAYSYTRCYRELCDENNINPGQLKTLDDIQKFPIFEKRYFFDSKPDEYLSQKPSSVPTFVTSSCGTTSGRKTNIHFDLYAVYEDTLQGVQQLYLQTCGGVEPEDLTVHFYAKNWWLNDINGKWRTQYIQCNKYNATEAAEKIRNMDTAPSILAGYPSLLQQLKTEFQPKEHPLKLVITNSEYSTRAERDELANHFGCPVLDEYSSEELTRIALEVDDGYYYINENSVFLEVLHPETRKPVPDGEWGEAVVTGLLNKAMPCIRYPTGDWVKRAKVQTDDWADIQWQRLEAIGGRIIDSLIRCDGMAIPSSDLLTKIDEARLTKYPEIKDYRITQSCQHIFNLAINHSENLFPEKLAAFADFVKHLVRVEYGAEIKFNWHDAQAYVPIGELHHGYKRRRFRCSNYERLNPYCKEANRLKAA